MFYKLWLYDDADANTDFENPLIIKFDNEKIKFGDDGRIECYNVLTRNYLYPHYNDIEAIELCTNANDYIIRHFED